jgi:uncharacterized protein YndB with AHSA1/START domain
MNTDLKNELTIIRVLDHPREKVWRACREIDALKEWWGMPKGAIMPVCNCDFRVGGALHFKVELPDGATLWFKCNYVEIVEGRKLVMEQHLSDENGSELDTPAFPVSTIAMCFEDMNGKTKLTITHTGMASEVHPVEQFNEGWSQSLDRLAECLARR